MPQRKNDDEQWWRTAPEVKRRNRELHNAEDNRKPTLWRFNKRAKVQRDETERYEQTLGEEASRWLIQAYVTLTFNTPRSVDSAMAAVKWWLDGLRCLGPGPDLFAFLAPERGSAGNVVHIEVLLGGLLPPSLVSPGARPFELQWFLHKAAERWVHGRINVERPRSRRAVAHYVVQQTRTSEWELVGTPIKRKKRRRKRHARKTAIH